MSCKKPNCDCLEQHAKKQGVNIYSVKGGYPCLYDNNNEDEATKSPKLSEQQPEGEINISQICKDLGWDESPDHAIVEAMNTYGDYRFKQGAGWQRQQSVSSWISVEERLPEMPNDYCGNKASNSVLVYNGEDIYKAFCEAVRPDFKTIVWDFSEEHGCSLCGPQYDGLDRIKDYSGKGITHWMPLPEKPTT